MAGFILLILMIGVLGLILNAEYSRRKKHQERMARIEDLMFESQWNTLSSMTEDQIKEKLSGDCGCKDISTCNYKNGCWFLKDKNNQPLEWKLKLNE